MNTHRVHSAILTLAGLALASSAFAQYPNPSPAPSTGSASGTTSGTTTTRTTTSTGTTYDLRDAEIIAVQGNEILFKSTDGYRLYTVAPDYRFMVNGQPVAMAQLKPGMKMTSQIQTTKPFVTMTTTEMRNAEVVTAGGTSVAIKDQSGQQRTFSDREFKDMQIVFMKDGRVVSASDLKQGDRVTAVMLTEGPASASGTTGMTGTTGPTGTTSPRPYESPSPSRDVASSSTYGEDTSTRERNLPKTASPWPLVALAGIFLIAIGGAVTLARRFYVG